MIEQLSNFLSVQTYISLHSSRFVHSCSRRGRDASVQRGIELLEAKLAVRRKHYPAIGADVVFVNLPPCPWPHHLSHTQSMALAICLEKCVHSRRRPVGQNRPCKWTRHPMDAVKMMPSSHWSTHCGGNFFIYSTFNATSITHFRLNGLHFNFICTKNHSSWAKNAFYFYF